MKLNVGSGRYPARGWVNVDRNGLPGVDVHASVVDGLPFADGSVTRIYAGHVLEHLSYDDELPRALRELRRLLAEDGQMMVVGPDINRADGYDAETRHAIWPGAYGPETPGMMHLWKPTVPAHEKALRAAGFAATELPVAAVTPDWPIVSRIGWQLAIFCARMDHGADA